MTIGLFFNLHQMRKQPSAQIFVHSLTNERGKERGQEGQKKGRKERRDGGREGGGREEKEGGKERMKM